MSLEFTFLVLYRRRMISGGVTLFGRGGLMTLRVVLMFDLILGMNYD